MLTAIPLPLAGETDFSGTPAPLSVSWNDSRPRPWLGPNLLPFISHKLLDQVHLIHAYLDCVTC